jgi:hypothetical protein
MRGTQGTNSDLARSVSVSGLLNTPCPKVSDELNSRKGNGFNALAGLDLGNLSSNGPHKRFQRDK